MMLPFLALMACSSIGITQEEKQNNFPNESLEPSETGTEENQDTSFPDDTGGIDSIEPAEEFVDFSQYGPHWPYGITTDSRTTAVTGCPNMEYEVYIPLKTV